MGRSYQRARKRKQKKQGGNQEGKGNEQEKDQETNQGEGSSQNKWNNKGQRERQSYSEIDKNNAAFEHFYKNQNLVPEEEWEEFVVALRKSLPATFRITGFKGHAQRLLQFLKGSYIKDLIADTVIDDVVVKKPQTLSWFPEEMAWQLDHNRQVLRKVPAFQKLHNFLVTETDSGNLSRQEAVSMIPPLLLDIRPSQKILDMCAAPGSKTAQIIEMLHEEQILGWPEGVVIGNDSDNKRCYIMFHQAKRLNSPCCMIVNHDARFFPTLYTTEKDGTRVPIVYDRILCDVPCSGDGTMRKNVLIWKKWGVNNGMNLHSLQAHILRRGAELLVVGGRLIYSTCSFNPLENEAVVASLLRESEGAMELVDVSDKLPDLKKRPGLKTWKVINERPQIFESLEDVPNAKKKRYTKSMWPPTPEEAETMGLDKCMRIVPHDQDTGGFFIAVLEKRKPLPFEPKQTVKPPKVPDVGGQNQEDGSLAMEDADQKPEGVQNEQSSAKESASASNIPPPKKRRFEKGSFKEDPFNYFKGDEEVWPPIKQFYGLDDSFPNKQLLTRSFVGKKRNLYFTSDLVKNIIETNEDKLKVINAGVKALSRSDSVDVECSFRLSQEGIHALYPFISARKVYVTKTDVINLLAHENPFNYTFSFKMQNQVDQLGQGSMTFVFDPNEEGDAVISNEEELVIVGWKGKTSIRSYLDKNSRQHYLRMCGMDLEEAQGSPSIVKPENPGEVSETDKDEGGIRIEGDGSSEASETGDSGRADVAGAADAEAVRVNDDKASDEGIFEGDSIVEDGDADGGVDGEEDVDELQG